MSEPKSFNVFLDQMAEREEHRFRQWCISNNYDYTRTPCNTRSIAEAAYHKAVSEQQKKLEIEQKATEDAMARYEKEARIRTFEQSIPTRYMNASIDDYGMKGESQKILNGASGLILGNNGPGKTRFKWAVARKWVYDGESVVIADAQEMLFRIKSADDPYLFIRKNYGLNTAHLVIDEIDKIFESKADFIYLNYLINFRYEWMLQTLVIGNGDSEKFIATLGQSIFARLAGEGGVCIAFNGTDWRFRKEEKGA